MSTSVTLTVLPTNATSIASSLLTPSLTGTPNGSPSIGTNSGGDGGVGGGGGPRGVNYFFGFLIAFVAFLLFFIGCGLGVRRGYLRRRRLAGADELEGGDLIPTTSLERLLSRNELPREPVLWETTFEKGDSQWETIAPLSATIVPPGTSGVLPPLYAPVPMPMPNWLRPPGPGVRSTTNLSSTGSRNMFPWWIPRMTRLPRRRPSHETITLGPGSTPLGSLSRTTSHRSLPSSVISEPLAMPMPDGNTMPLVKKPMADPMPKPTIHPDLQIVVMIAMPSESLGELQFGVAKLPVMWDSGSL